MHTRVTLSFFLACILGVAASPLSAEELQGIPGAADGPSWSSAWLELSTPTLLKKGDTLRLEIAGDAKKVVVRLLPEGADPSKDTGVLGNPLAVSKGGTVEVPPLTRDYPKVVQISVHGGAKAWKQVLGTDNGPVTELRKVTRTP